MDEITPEVTIAPITPKRGLPSQMDDFARLVAGGMLQTDAAREVGYGTPNVKASKLMKNPAVLARIKELGGIAGRKTFRDVVEQGKRARVKKLAKGVASGETLEVAARKAGYEGHTRNTLEAAASRALSTPAHIRAIKEVLAEYKLNDDCGARVLMEGLSAMKGIVLPGGKDTPATIVDYPDYMTRKFYVDILFKLLGHYKDTGGDERTIVNIINHVKSSPMLSAKVVEAEVVKDGEGFTI